MDQVQVGLNSVTNNRYGMVNIGKALLKAQSVMGAASKGAKNPFFKSKYADYGSVLEAVKQPLNDAGIVILQSHRAGYNGNNGYESPTVVVTMLLHAESGESLVSETPVIVAKPNDPQAFGSAITYARRYGLQSMLALPTEDDDAEGAMARNTKPVVTKVTPAVTTVPTTQTNTTEVTTPAVPQQAVKSSFRKPSPPAPRVEAKTQADESNDWEN